MQATTVQPAPATATAAAPVVAPTPTVTFTDVDGTTTTLAVPLTKQGVADLSLRRERLSDQLTSAVSRRRRISEEIRSAPDGVSRSGLEQRLTVLDKRIVQLETDIASSGRQLAAVPQSLVGDDWTPPGGADIPTNVMRLGGMAMVFVAFPIAIAIARFIWRRARAPSVVQQHLSPAVEQRLERVEQGVDAIAIEIERVAEGQRFVTRLLSEGQGALRLPQGEGVGAKATS